ncbi:hypothetical protein [Sphaerisporangium sp. NPDC051011]|uniref:hypothetical protein n=1 Tax=Sphaerisporangium sp. NPDC051011 TaxID=3155792 RepID=UPI00340F06B6
MFYAGAAALAARYEHLGLTQLLPTDRVWVGVRSNIEDAFGGFHHPDQGYRHLQMGAIITRYGPLDGSTPSPLAALDLLRAYAHDCLHYGSYRRYSIHVGQVVRTHYGINVRSVDGTTYSPPDPAGATTTRNLGVLMEGATDREARALTRSAAAHADIIGAEHGPDWYGFGDVTGRLTTADTAALGDPAHRAAITSSGEVDGYLRRLGSYQTGVNARYETFLAELGGGEREALHEEILRAMISGSMGGLCAWLDQRHGPGTFARLFRSPAYLGPEPGC